VLDVPEVEDVTVLVLVVGMVEVVISEVVVACFPENLTVKVGVFLKV
jgi:hypothetical protein